MKRMVLLLSVGFSVVCHAKEDADLHYGGHTYRIVKKAATWQQAKAAAEKAGGQLLIIDSAAENNFIYKQLQAVGITTTAPDGGGARYVWLGGSDIAKEGEWRWVDGRLMSDGYTKWGHGGEPDNYRNIQDCLAMGLTVWPVGSGRMGSPSEWNDISGKNCLAYVIEFDKNHP